MHTRTNITSNQLAVQETTFLPSYL